MSVVTIVALVGGLACLVAGAEFLVRGAAGIAGRLGIAPVIVGLTVVAFGTSAPELAVSVSASTSGSADVALGNVLRHALGIPLMPGVIIVLSYTVLALNLIARIFPPVVNL